MILNPLYLKIDRSAVDCQRVPGVVNRGVQSRRDSVCLPYNKGS